MLNPKRNDFSEVVKIPMTDIEHANRGNICTKIATNFITVQSTGKRAFVQFS